ncbi:P-loop containing nucleoside triphosphate hydrolase protein [Boletus edulis BED1]|uniref:P-loop containing nucleoside triphosphate hydrolase protein n=1 Tax=Boletus edulis BED1 TaxID=1328754 RepID=A0AAD4C4N5_BOLED|nr:P-loop containing nucleoside triphosphate hydrolase protein [Boletus edulis BED1]
MFKLALACIRHRPVHVSVRTFSVPLHTRPALRRASFFPWSSTVSPPPPSLDTAAEIAALEARANAHPDDVQKQLAFFNALIVTRTKEGYDTVIDRWEHTSERNPSSPLLHSDDAFKVYLDALASSDREPSIDNAVRKRQSLLDSLPPFPPSSDTSPSSPPEPPPTPPPQSRSEKIAAELLARRANPTSQDPSPLNPAIADLAAALSKGGGVSGNPIHVTLSEPKGSFTMRIVRFVVLAGLSGFFMLVILSVLLENSGLLKTGGRATEFEPLQQKPVKFDDVHGIDEVKQELADVITFLKDPTAFASLGGKLPKGILLTGPPGTGKTMLARAIAGEAGVPFFFSSGSEFEEMFVGVGAKRVRDLFAAARKKQPAIIFIDELDAVGGKRSQRDQHYMKQTLNQLLVEMDGFLQTEGVIVIAATNFPQSLDPALTRPGRFDRHIAVPLPDVRGRLQLLSHFMKDVIASNAVDPMILARGTPGFSGAELQNMVNLAAIQAAKEGCKEVILKHFEWAKDRIVMGAERKSAYIDEKNKLLTAYHEGGHALAALYTEGAMPLHKVTCVPRGHALGVTSQLPEGDMFSISQSEYKAMIDVCMGGRVAETLIYGEGGLTSGCSSDLQKATHTATQMVKNFGFSDKVGPVYYSDQNGPVSPQASERIDSAILTRAPGHNAFGGEAGGTTSAGACIGGTRDADC